MLPLVLNQRNNGGFRGGAMVGVNLPFFGPLLKLFGGLNIQKRGK